MRPEAYLALSEIVQAKSWSRFDGVVCKGSVYEALVEMLSGLTNNEIEIMLEVIKGYHIQTEYYDSSAKLLALIVTAFPNIQRMYVCPVRLKNGVSVKSGHIVAYEIGVISVDLTNRSFKSIEDPHSEKIWNTDIPVIFVDDYIGTGDQFFEMMAEIEGAFGKQNNIALATLYIQEEAYSRITDAGITCIALQRREKAIATMCQMNGLDAKKVYQIYDSAEKRIGFPLNYLRGRMKCEGSITLKRTPNNTLPMFWCKNKDNWPAPFRR